MKLLLSLFILFISLGASAQQVWTMNNCMKYAIKHGFTSQRAVRNVRDAQQDYTAAIGSHLPQLSASVGLNTSFGRGLDPGTNTYVNTSSLSNGYNANVSIPIFNAFELLNRTLSSKVALARSESELQKAEDDIAIEIMGLYIDLLYKNGLVDLTEKRVETFKTNLTQTERMCELGTKNLADVAEIASSLANEEVALINRRNEHRTAVLKLKDKMNFPIEDSLPVDTTIMLSVRSFDDAATIFNQAEQYLPQIDILKKTLKFEKYQLSIAKSGYYPSIYASGSVGTSYFTMLSGTDDNNKADNFGKQFRDNIGEGVSVSMSIPIFRGLATRTAVHKAKNRYEQAQSDFSEKMRTLRIEIEQAVMDLEAAEESINGSEKAVKASALAYRAAQRKYEQGLCNVVDLYTSYNKLLQAEVDLLTSRLKHEIKSREVAYYSGEALVKPE